jgi:hypothetical protein
VSSITKILLLATTVHSKRYFRFKWLGLPANIENPPTILNIYPYQGRVISWIFGELGMGSGEWGVGIKLKIAEYFS